MITHPFAPVYDAHSEILILGTMPSPKSREANFYYAHPQNIFWRTLSFVLNCQEPETTTSQRKEFLLHHHIALWDVLECCDIIGAEDSTIKNEKANDIVGLLSKTNIQTVFTTGKTAKKLYDKYCYESTGKDAIYLPSTSPANRGQQKKAEYMDLWIQIRSHLSTFSS